MAGDHHKTRYKHVLVCSCLCYCITGYFQGVQYSQIGDILAFLDLIFLNLCNCAISYMHVQTCSFRGSNFQSTVKAIIERVPSTSYMIF